MNLATLFLATVVLQDVSLDRWTVIRGRWGVWPPLVTAIVAADPHDESVVAVHCQPWDRQVNAHITVADEPLGTGARPVFWKAGRQPQRTGSWGTTASMPDTVVAGETEALQFANGIATANGSETLIYRVVASDGTELDDAVTLRDARPAVRQVLAACEYQIP